MKLVSTLLFPLALISGAFATDADNNTEKSDTKVEVLTEKTFDDFVKPAPLVLVKFYAPWCGHCKSMAPDYDKASLVLAEKDIKLAKVDCTVETELCNKYEVQGFPTLKYFREGEPSEYNGARSADAIQEYMIRKSLPSVSDVTSKNIKEFTSSAKVVVVGFFEDKESEEYQNFNKAANKLNDDYIFGAVVDSKLAKKEGAKTNSVIVYKQFDDPKATIELSDSLSELTQAIKTAATPLIDDIGPENYSKYIESELPLAYIFIETEEHRKEYESIFKPLAKEHKGKLNFVFIDSTKYGRQAEVVNLKQEFPAFGIQQLKPSGKFPFDQSKDLTEKDLTKFVNDFVTGKLEPSIKSEPIPESKDGNVTVLVADNFKEVALDKSKDVLVEFYAPWCGHCKKLAPLYDELAALYPDSSDIVVTKFDAVANDIPFGLDFEIQGFPTIKLFKADSNEIVDFNGDRTVEGFAEFLTKESKSGFKPELPVAEAEAETETKDDEDEEL